VRRDFSERLLFGVAADDAEYNRRGVPMESTKRCPFCAEEIQTAATRCKHCASDITLGDYRLDRRGNETKPEYFSLLGPILVVLLVIVGGIGAFNWSQTGSLLGHGFTQEDISRLRTDIRSEFSKRESVTVDEVTLIRESPTKLVGFVKLKVPLFGTMNKSCTATMSDDSQIIWRCE
jgi:hypothetical protein